MRWFLGLLVLVNVVILLWGSLSDEQGEDEQLAMPGVGSIRLVDQPDQSKVPAAVPIPAPPRSNGVLNTAPAIAQAQQAPVSGDVEVKSLALPAPEEATRPESPAPLVEAPAAQPAEPVAQRPSAPAVDTQPTRPRFCSRIGPFADSEAAQVVRSYLADRGGKVEEAEETHNIRVGHWVMVPPLADRAAAKALSEQLKAKGIKDFWIIPEGQYQHAVSLGVFSQQANASAFAKRVADKGFTVSTVEKLKAQTAVWLRYQGATFIPPMEIRARAPDGVQAEHQDCP
jgi:hypothetical protein